jgi:hypothetical protein
LVFQVEAALIGNQQGVFDPNPAIGRVGQTRKGRKTTKSAE